MDNLTLGTLQRLQADMPPELKAKIMFAHPDEFDNIVSVATTAGAFVIPYTEVDDGWHYQIVFVSDGPGWVTVTRDELLLTEHLPPGGVYVANRPESAILRPPITLFPTR